MRRKFWTAVSLIALTTFGCDSLEPSSPAGKPAKSSHAAFDEEPGGERSNERDGRRDAGKTPRETDSDGLEDEEDEALDQVDDATLLSQVQSCIETHTVWVPTGAMSGNAAGGCGARQVDWCCSFDEIKRRFLGDAAAVARRIQPLLDDGFEIYGCAGAPAGKTEVHLLKVARKELRHDSVLVGGLDDSMASGEVCAGGDGVILGMLQEASTEALPEEHDPAPSVAEQRVSSVLEKRCGGSCHGPSAQASLRFVENLPNARIRAREILARLAVPPGGDGRMPPGSQDLPDADREALETYFSALD